MIKVVRVIRVVRVVRVSSECHHCPQIVVFRTSLSVLAIKKKYINLSAKNVVYSLARLSLFTGLVTYK